MANMMNFIQLLGMARQNPQQAAMSTLQQMYSAGRINIQQYNFLAQQVQNGANPNQIIQQMLNSGMVNQEQYESARQSAQNFR